MQTPLVRYMLRPHQNLLLIRCSSASVVPVPRRQIRLLSSSRPSRRSRKKSIEDPSSPSPAPQPRMASQRTVADVLMGAARAAAEKKAKKSAQAPDAVPVQPLKKSKTRDSQKVTDATLLKEEKEEKNLELEPRKKGSGFDPKFVSPCKDAESIPSVLMGAARAAAEKKAKKSTQAPDAVPAQPSKKSKTRDSQMVTDATLVKEEKEEENLELEPRKKGSGFDPKFVSSCKDAESIPSVLMGAARAAAEKKAKKSTQAPDAVPAQPSKKSKTRDRQNVTDATLVKEEKEEKNLELEPRKKGSGFDPKFVSPCKDAESIPSVLMGAARAAAEKKAKKSTQAPDAVPAQPLKKSKTRDSQNVTDATLLKEEKEEKNLELEPRKKGFGLDPESVSSLKDGESIPSILMGAARVAAEKKAKKSTQARDAVPAQPSKKSKTRDHQNVTDATLVKEEKEEKNLELEPRKKGSGFDPCKDAESIPPVLMGPAGAAAEKKAKKSTQAPDAVPAQPLKKSKTRDRQNVTDATLLKEVKEEKNLELEPRKKGSGFDPKFVSSCKDAESIPPVLMGAARAAAEKKAKKSTQAPDAVPAQSLKKSKTRDSQNVTDATLLKEEKVEKNLELEPRKKESGFDPRSVSSCKDAESIPSVLMGAARAAAEKKEKKSTQAPDAVPAQPLKKSKTRDRQNVTDATLLKEEKKEKNLELELRKKGSGFDPKSVASWKDGESIPFLFIARALDLISNESGRIAIADILTNVFRTVIATTPGDLVSVVYLSANKIAPPHEGLELGIGDATIIRALAEAYGRKEEHVKNQLKELGDLGLVAKASRLSQRVMFKPKPLTVSKVLDTFRSIAKESGKDSQDKKRNHIKGLLVAATDCEPQYLIRLLQSKMRIGLAEQTVLISLGQAAVYCDKSLTASMESSHEEAAKIVKQVYSVLPDYDKIIPNLLHVGVWKLPEVCKFSLGVPVKPMLAKPTKGVSEILDKFQGIEFTCEYKYDGERAQIHCMEDGSIEIYSRNAERNTGKFPDVVASVSRFKKPSVKSFVLDCEVVAYDREKQKILPFQILSTRARKDVAMSDIKVEVCTFAFDLLFLNGEDLLQQQLKDRRQHLYDSFEEIPGYFQFATALTSTDLEEIQKFLQSAMDASCEGLIIKTLDGDATYEPSRRSNNWLKLKKDYMDSIGDSLDLVPIAAFHGRGKRTGVYGSFLLACYDEQNEEYQSICNIGTGFSEKDLEERSSSLRSRVIPKPKPYYRFGESLNPDVWFEPAEVWEVKAADLSISPVHRAAHGAVDPIKGISLRFPRLLRIRDDKNPEQATTAEQVAELYRAQKFNHVNNLTEDNDD